MKFIYSYGDFFIKLRNIPTNSSKSIGDFFEVLNVNRLFLKLNRFICNYTKYEI